MNSAVRRAAVLAGAGALVASASALVTPAAHAVGAGTGQYNCTSTLKGSPISVGTWTAAVAAFSPSSVARGATISTPLVTGVISAPAQAAALLQAKGIVYMQGTVTVKYSATGAVANPGARSTTVAAPLAVVPSSNNALGVALVGGPITDTAANKAGTVTYATTSVSGTFKTNKGTTLPISCTPVGGPVTIATVTVK
ncbi:hypothetical protein [Branchiibius sp. NY16-3462-2]|uniref:hypothetical protein n=1 Tax=Branchiibius sp. NY16-3462-2 TaxID=1807500 RepID=UPI000794811E|nr:hypothetical protein [Branchiibius sp. NY16-3462-2]KYH42955.1 hypothetical protein AZH51_05735 [Branchiibius sp. NY16-3462-2]